MKKKGKKLSAAGKRLLKTVFAKNADGTWKYGKR